MYLFIEEDGDVTQSDVMPENLSYDCWPRVIKVELYAGPDHSAFKMTEGGWEEIEEEI